MWISLGSHFSAQHMHGLFQSLLTPVLEGQGSHPQTCQLPPSEAAFRRPLDSLYIWPTPGVSTVSNTSQDYVWFPSPLPWKKKSQITVTSATFLTFWSHLYLPYGLALSLGTKRMRNLQQTSSVFQSRTLCSPYFTGLMAFSDVLEGFYLIPSG